MWAPKLGLLAAAIKEGSAAVREAAMDAIADHVAGVPEFEPYALEAATKDQSADTRRAPAALNEERAKRVC